MGISTADKGQEKAGLHAVAAIYLFMVACMVPLYMRNGYYGLSTGKFMLYRNTGFFVLPVLFSVCAGKGICRIKQMGRRQEEAVRKWIISLLPEIFLFGYGLCNLLSFFLSPYKKDGLFGAEGWYMGLFSQLSFLLLYFYYAYVWKAEKEAVAVILAVGGFICALAVLNRFGIWPAALPGRTEGTLSTIGNVNWLCGYLSVMLPAGTVLFWGSRRNTERGQAGKAAAAGLFTAAAFLCTAIQGSDSGLLVSGTVLCILFRISCRDAEGMDAFWDVLVTAAGAWLAGGLLRDCFPQRILYESKSLALLSVKTAAPVFLAAAGGRAFWKYRRSKGDPELCRRQLVRMKKGFTVFWLLLLAGTALLLAAGVWGPAALKERLPALFIPDAQWGNGRGGIWGECLDIWSREPLLRRLFGVGPDCLNAFLYTEQGSRPLLAVTYRDAVLTNCHNEWMTILMNTGAAGLLAYVGFLVTVFMRLFRKRSLPALVGAAVLLTYTVHNMVSFQQITSTPLLFLALGLSHSLSAYSAEACI